MGKIIDLRGRKFGRLTVVEFSHANRTKYYWKFKCDCGNEIITRADAVKNGRVKSCGCLNEEQLRSYKNKEKLLRAAKMDCYKNTKICTLKSKLGSTNKSGYKGVYWDESHKKWRAQINIQGKRYHLGRHSRLEDAIKARREAEEKYFKPLIEEYENGGQINE